MYRLTAQQEDCEATINGFYDYHSEYWASEIESMKDEGKDEEMYWILEELKEGTGVECTGFVGDYCLVPEPVCHTAPEPIAYGSWHSFVGPMPKINADIPF